MCYAAAHATPVPPDTGLRTDWPADDGHAPRKASREIHRLRISRNTRLPSMRRSWSPRHGGKYQASRPRSGIPTPSRSMRPRHLSVGNCGCGRASTSSSVSPSIFPLRSNLNGTLDFSTSLDQCVEGRGTQTLVVLCKRMYPHGGQRDPYYEQKPNDG